MPNFLKSIVKSKSKGFTLIELLIVISIIAILVAAASVSWKNAQEKGRDGKRKTDLKAIQQALETYLQTTGHYPPYDAATSNENIGWCTIISSVAYPVVLNSLEPTYITKIPTDPVYAKQNKDYFYKKTGVARYELYASLENTNDPDVSGPYPFACEYPGPYNYKVTNP